MTKVSYFLVPSHVYCRSPNYFAVHTYFSLLLVFGVSNQAIGYCFSE